MKYANIDNIPKNPREILDYAKSKSFHFHIDEKGTKKHPSNWQRKLSDLSYDKAFEIIQENNPHWIFSFRNVSKLSNGIEDDYWEFGGCNIGSNDYGSVFIWINVNVEEAIKIFEKFGLGINEY